jgi:putative multiple sugar transport system substrate-binding protein
MIILIITLSLSASVFTDTGDNLPEFTCDDSAPQKGKIGIAMPTKSLERWNRDGSFLKNQFQSHGYNVNLVYSGNSVTQQISDIEKYD